jgi:hypothetical protein
VPSAEVGLHANRVAARLVSDEVNRYWSGDLLMYCRLNPQQQAAFLTEIQQSQTAIQASSADLRNLIAQLRP